MQEQNEYTLWVIRHRFGMTPTQVAQSLTNTKLTLDQLIKLTKLDRESICEALTALMQHDIVSAEVPFDLTRPQKGAARGKKNQSTSMHTTLNHDGYEGPHDHAPEVTRSVGEFGDVASRHFGNFAAGFNPEQPQHVNAVYQAIIPTTRTIYDNTTTIPPPVDNYLYSLNHGMVRGIARSHFYSTLVSNLTHNIEAAEVINQFSFRGKMTLMRAIECTVETILAKEDNALRVREKVDGFDPEYTVEMFNAMGVKELETKSIFSFQRARLFAERGIKTEENAFSSAFLPLRDRSSQSIIGGISRETLEYMDEIELQRYEAIIPRVLEGLKVLDQFYLLVESPGFIDQQIFQANPLVANPPVVATAQPLQGKLDPTSPSLLNNSPDDDNDTAIDPRKRKLIRSAIQQATTMTNQANAQNSSEDNRVTFSVNTAGSVAIYTRAATEEDDLFDPDPAPGSNKRFKYNNSSSSSSSSSSPAPLLSLLSYQSPLSPDRRVYILNHDRFTLFYRGEILADYVEKHHGPLASIIIHAINNFSLRFEHPQELCEFTIAMIQEAIELLIPTLVLGLPKDIQERIRTTPPPEPKGRDFDSRLTAIHYCFHTQLQPEPITIVLRSLLREGYDNNNESKAVQFIQKKQPTAYTIGYHRSKYTPGSKYANSLEETCYVLYYHRFLQCIRRDYLAQHVHTQFGAAGRSVFLTLVDNLRMEEKTICETALTTRKEAKEILNNLHMQGLAELLEIPVTSERSTMPRSFFVWTVDYTFAANRMLARFYKSYSNLLCRLDFERDSQTQIIDKVALHQHMEISDSERVIAEQYDRCFTKVQTVLYATSKAIMVFKDLCPR